MFGGKDFFGVLPHIPVSFSDGNLYYYIFRMDLRKWSGYEIQTRD